MRHVRAQLARFRGRKIIFSCPMMIGLPTETPVEMRETINFAIELLGMGPNFRMPQLLIYTPCPGTELFSRAEASGARFPSRLEDWINYEVSFSQMHEDRPEYKDRLERISFLSKFLDRKMDDYHTNSPVFKAVYNIFKLAAWTRLRTGFLKPLPGRALYKFIKNSNKKN